MKFTHDEYMLLSSLLKDRYFYVYGQLCEAFRFEAENIEFLKEKDREFLLINQLLEKVARSLG